MNAACARCGRALSSSAAACEHCGANAPADSNNGWGALDIQRGVLPVQRRALSEAKPENQQTARNPHDDMRASLTNSLPASEAQPAPATRTNRSPAPQARG